jgi:hypothetical protein
MAAWRAILWSVLVSCAGLLWIFVISSFTYIVPTVNYFISTGSVSNQTAEVVSANLDFVLLTPGVAIVFFGVALLIDAVQGGRV